MGYNDPSPLVSLSLSLFLFLFLFCTWANYINCFCHISVLSLSLLSLFFFGKGFPLSQEELDGAFKKIDLNGDGGIDYVRVCCQNKILLLLLLLLLLFNTWTNHILCFLLLLLFCKPLAYFDYTKKQEVNLSLYFLPTSFINAEIKNCYFNNIKQLLLWWWWCSSTGVQQTDALKGFLNI